MTHNKSFNLLIASLILTFGFVSVGNQMVSVAAQSTNNYSTESMTTQKSDVKDQETTKITGKVLKVDNNKLTVDANGTKEYTVGDNISITRNTVKSSVKDIKPNDQVTITKSSEDEVLSIESTGSEVFDSAKFLIPGVILALILLGLGYYSWKKSKKGFIKTTTERVS